MKIALIILLVRLWVQNSLWSWNHDIQTAILPGLQCWYCQPSQAPYGLLWHIISYPLSFGGSAYFYTLGTTIGDFFAMRLIGKRQILPIYAIGSFWIWLQAPYDIPILWLCLFGLVSWPLAFLGPIGKLPVLAPASTWQFVLSRHYISSDFQYYALMGIVFITVIVQSVRYERK